LSVDEKEKRMTWVVVPGKAREECVGHALMSEKDLLLRQRIGNKNPSPSQNLLQTETAFLAFPASFIFSFISLLSKTLMQIK
jgi:hypothetical protein